MTGAALAVRTTPPPKPSLAAVARRFKLDTTELAPRASELGYDVRSLRVADRQELIAVLDLIKTFLTEKGFTASVRRLIEEKGKPYGHTYGNDYYSKDDGRVFIEFGAMSGDAHAIIAIRARNTTLAEIKEHVETYKES